MPEYQVRTYRRFIAQFLVVLLATVNVFFGGLYTLNAFGALPPPPFTGTDCIDEKLRFLADTDLAGVDLIAVGSSVTWRNLDVRALAEAGLAERPINAAPCYLYMGQTAFLTRFLLGQMPHVRTVVTVVAPRDFEACTGPEEPFFSAGMARAFVFKRVSSAFVYLTNIRPLWFFRDAWHVKERRADPAAQFTLFTDSHGAGPITTQGDWLPEPKLQEACFAALSRLEEVVHARGAKLIVAAFPLSPAWRSKYDPEGAFVPSFEHRVRAALHQPSSRFVGSDADPAPPEGYADAVHLLWPAAVKYSHALARTLTGTASAP